MTIAEWDHEVEADQTLIERYPGVAWTVEMARWKETGSPRMDIVERIDAAQKAV